MTFVTNSVEKVEKYIDGFLAKRGIEGHQKGLTSVSRLSVRYQTEKRVRMVITEKVCRKHKHKRGGRRRRKRGVRRYGKIISIAKTK